MATENSKPIVLLDYCGLYELGLDEAFNNWGFEPVIYADIADAPSVLPEDSGVVVVSENPVPSAWRGKANFLTILESPHKFFLGMYYKFAFQHAPEGLNLLETANSYLGTYLEQNDDCNVMTKLLANLFEDDAEVSLSPEAMEKKARKNIENHFCAIGFEPQIQETVFLFCSALGWPLPERLIIEPPKVAIPEFDSLPIKIQSGILEATAFDRRLYVWCKSEFDNRLDFAEYDDGSVNFVDQTISISPRDVLFYIEQKKQAQTELNQVQRAFEAKQQELDATKSAFESSKQAYTELLRQQLATSGILKPE